MSITALNGLQTSSRRQRIVKALTEMFAQLFGKDSELDVNASMIDLGGDSLFLLQAANAIREKFKVRIPFRLLLEELSTIDSLAAHLDQKLPPDAVPSAIKGASAVAKTSSQTVEQAVSPAPAVVQERPAPLSVPSVMAQQMAGLGGAKSTITESDPVYQIFGQQLALMSQQIAILIGQPNITTQSVGAQAPGRATDPVLAQAPSMERQASVTAPPAVPASEIEPDVYVPHEVPETGATKSLSERQRKHLAALIDRLNRRTGGSKRITQEYRNNHADNRTVAGFRTPWKEIFYPLVVERGQGSHIWDVDGNEYIDMTMGFGALLFGHSPAFITETLKQQLDFGLRLGPHSREAGEAARLISELTGVERVAFCNSGTEAVMTALRLARTVTGRSRIALFEGCYHGTFDGILVKGQRRPDGAVQCIPLAPGIPEHMIGNVLMLKYNDPESLEILRAHAGELAAVLIEPPRSRRPDVHPREFLLELRRITETSGAALIFDEVVTGFRFHPGGAQAMFDIRADLVTYGKAMAGGLPVAAIAGKAKFMNAVDGGMWQYGDASYPEAEITFFTGTYFKHPLFMPSVVATLRHIKESGIQLQESMNAKAKYAADALGAFLKEQGFPLRVAHFGSLFRILHGPELRYMDLFYYHLLDKGVYVCETHNFLLSTAHTDSDMEAFVRAAKESFLELREGGFLPEPATILPVGTDTTRAELGTSGSNTTARAPLTEAQRQIWAVSHMGEGDARAYNLPLAIQWKGDLDASMLRKTINAVVQRHEAFRATFSPDGDFQLISPLTLDLPIVDLYALPSDQQRDQIENWRRSEATQLFNFETGPLLSVRLLTLKPDLHLLLVTMHHIISDGWSLGVFLQELMELYTAETTGRSAQLLEPRSFADYARAKAATEAQLSGSEAEEFWINEFPNSIPAQHLPTDMPLHENVGIAGAQRRVVMPAAVTGALKELSRRYTCTRFMVMLAICKVFIYYLTEQEEVIIGVPTAGQSHPDGGYVAGCCVNLLALRTHMNTDLSFPELVVLQRQKLVEAYDHAAYPFSGLLKRLRAKHPDKPEPAISVIFNLDRSQGSKKQHGFEIDVLSNHNETSKFDLTIDITDTPDSLVIDFEYKSELFTAQRIANWMELFQRLIREISERPSAIVRDYFAALLEEETRQNSLATQELKRQEHNRFTASKRKSVVS